MLQPLGLDELSYGVYRFTLGRPGCCIEDISRHLGASPGDVQRKVERLLELSLLRQVSGTLVPTRPPTALRSLLEGRQSELLRQQQEFAQIKAAVNRLTEEYEKFQGPPGAQLGWERLENQAAVYARLERLVGRTRIECLSMLPCDALAEEALAALRPLDQHLLDSGVSVWSIYRESAYNDRPTLTHARWLAQNGAEVGTVPTLPLWLVIFDRETALLPIDPDEPHGGALQIVGAGLLTSLVALFERFWAMVTPLDARPCGDAAGPTPIERELLRLMGQGLTDEAACKKLGVGVRTLRRMIADLMERLDAHSRFEAGANAVDRGWLHPCRRSGDRPLRERTDKGAKSSEHEKDNLDLGVAV